VDKIPPVENYQNHAQKSAIGDTGDTGDILPTSMEGYTKLVGNSIDTATMIIPQQQQEQEQQQKQFRFECYYCNTFRTDIRKDYESHVLLRHPGKPCYPSKADLDKFGLDVKRKEWET
jgi:hypothetical protein